jgi:predicted nucleic acid-binding protein
MIAFDTNVLIYTCDLRDAHRQERALELLEGAPDGVLLWQVAVD